ncbi:hypothetical protein [Beijerinckia mobilis]|uniref:hypothetical protein n=1 Tax=Beijerinckia mobilis TaxID=231434 RepID=UPI00054E64CC|nr:hypothetical protein [Beijerinckia mobilis]
MMFLIRVLFWLTIVFSAIFPSPKTLISGSVVNPGRQTSGTAPSEHVTKGAAETVQPHSPSQQSNRDELAGDKRLLDKAVRALVTESPDALIEFCRNHRETCTSTGASLSHLLEIGAQAERH